MWLMHPTQYCTNPFNCIAYKYVFALNSDETTTVNQSGLITQVTTTTTDHDGYGVWRRPRSESSVDADSVYNTNAIISESSVSHSEI